MQWLTNPRRHWFAAQHYKALSNRLKKYGLRYDDLYDLDIKEALARLPREVVDARNQRLKRAIDLSMKHEYLPEDLQALQTPFRSYLKDMLALISITSWCNPTDGLRLSSAVLGPLHCHRVKKDNAEREALGALPVYQRTIP